ncbi:hypothetical protein ACVWXM_009691 [Bradyrhizobium sp. GM7.3]
MRQPATADTPTNGSLKADESQHTGALDGPFVVLLEWNRSDFAFQTIMITKSRPSCSLTRAS